MKPNLHELKLKPTDPVFGESRGGVYLISNNRQLYFSAQNWDDVVRLVGELEANGRRAPVQNYVEAERTHSPSTYTAAKPAKPKAALDDLV